MQHLLDPINDDMPCGDYLKNNRSAYRELRNSYNKALSAFRTMMESPDSMQNDELTETNRICWVELSALCEKNLASVSKDVEVFCWFITAQIFSDKPLENLRDSLETLRKVIEQYWEYLNPRPPVEKLKSDDTAGQQKEWAEIRVKPLIQLIGESEGSGLLYMPLQNIILAGQTTYNQYCVAEISGKAHELKSQLVAYLPDERAEICARIELLIGIQQSIEMLDLLVNERCHEAGASGISFLFLKHTFAALTNAFQFLFAEEITPWPGQPVPEEEDGILSEVNGPVQDASGIESALVNNDVVTSPPLNTEVLQSASDAISPVFAANEHIGNRDQAFNELRKIADFFQRTEPHSPVYMLLERAIRWGYMSLPELLQEMVGENQPVMDRISQLAGLENTEKTAIPDVSAVAATPMAREQDAQKPPQLQKAVETITDDTQEPPSSGSPEKSSGVSDFEW